MNATKELNPEKVFYSPNNDEARRKIHKRIDEIIDQLLEHGHAEINVRIIMANQKIVQHDYSAIEKNKV